MKKTLNKLSDETLIELYRSGEDMAFNILLSRYNNSIRQYIRMIVFNQEEANDLFQEICCLLSVKLKDVYKENGKFSSWLHRVVNNYLISYCRKKKKILTCEDIDKLGHIEYDPYSSLSPQCREDKFSALQEMVETLPDQLKILVKLRIWEKMTLQAIADLLGMKKSTVAERLHTAYRKLEQKLIEKGYDDAMI